MTTILHINCASTGSTGKIIGDIATHTVESGFQHILCCPCAPGSYPQVRYVRTSLPYEQGLYQRLNYFYGYQYGFAPLSTIKIKHLIKKEKPDLIHLHCLNGYTVNVYQLLQLIKKLQIPTVITNHAEFYYTGSCPYSYDCEGWMTGCGKCPQLYDATGSKFADTSSRSWQKMQSAFANLPHAEMVSVSPWVAARATRSPITKNLPQRVVLNGINTNIFRYQSPYCLRKKLGIDPDTQIIFHPTAHFSDSESDRKGGRFIISLAERLSNQNIRIFVAGEATPNLRVPPNVHLLGKITDQQLLADYYALADLTVVVGKRETFNMPVAESLCCGTPVAGFCAGGPESVTIQAYSQFVPYADMDQLTIAVEHLLSQDFDPQAIAREAKQKYSAAGMAAGYTSIYNRLLANRGL